MAGLDIIIHAAVERLRTFFSDPNVPLNSLRDFAAMMSDEQLQIILQREVDTCQRYFDAQQRSSTGLGASAQSFVDAFTLVDLLPRIESLMSLVNPEYHRCIAQDAHFRELAMLVAAAKQPPGLLLRDASAKLAVVQRCLSVPGGASLSSVQAVVFSELEQAQDLMKWLKPQLNSFRATFGLPSPSLCTLGSGWQ